MATWTTIPDGSLEPGKPIRSIDTLALRDNPVAIAEGAAGAPKVRLIAVETLTPGDVVRSAYDEAVAIDPGTDWQYARKFGFMQSGSARITFEHRRSGGTISNVEARVARLRNGVFTVLQTWATSNTTHILRTIDFSVIPGDTIFIEHRSLSGANGVTINNRLQTNGVFYWPAPTDVRLQ